MCLCDGERERRERGSERAAAVGQALCHVVTQMDRSKHWIAAHLESYANQVVAAAKVQ